MLGWLILLLTLVPIAELTVLLSVHRALADVFGGRVALLISIGSVVMTGVLGAWLARRQGLAALRALRSTLERGEYPGTELMDTVLIVVGGALLLTPGYLTDVVGISLLIPWTRRLHRQALTSWLHRRIAVRTMGWSSGERDASGQPAASHDSSTRNGPVVIEETFVVRDDPRPGR